MPPAAAAAALTTAAAEVETTLTTSRTASLARVSSSAGGGALASARSLKSQSQISAGDDGEVEDEEIEVEELPSAADEDPTDVTRSIARSLCRPTTSKMPIGMPLAGPISDEGTPPTFIHWPASQRHVILLKPDHVTLECGAFGDPPPNYSFEAISPGVYRCLAVNSLGVAVSDVAIARRSNGHRPSNNGALLFGASVRQSDGSGVYRCGWRDPGLRRIIERPPGLPALRAAAWPTRTRDLSIFFDSRPDVSESGRYVCSKPATAFSAGTLMLFCFFSGNPPPTIAWQVALLVASRYRCVATSNSGVVAFSDFHLQIVLPPIWSRPAVAPPSTLSLPLATGLVMRCQGDRMRMAQRCQWISRNGVSLKLNSSSTTESVVMVTDSASYADRAVYQCNCTSGLPGAYLYANAYVNVVARRPKIRTKQLAHWAWLTPVSLCRVDPSLGRLSKQVDFLNGSRYQLLGLEWGGLADLTVDKLQLSDGGQYRCRLINHTKPTAPGSASVQQNLTVLQPTRVLAGPADALPTAGPTQLKPKSSACPVDSSRDSRLANNSGYNGVVSYQLAQRDGLALTPSSTNFDSQRLTAPMRMEAELLEFEDWLVLSPVFNLNTPADTLARQRAVAMVTSMSIRRSRRHKLHRLVASVEAARAPRKLLLIGLQLWPGHTAWSSPSESVNERLQRMLTLSIVLLLVTRV
uniref:Ig-like domain-containing protein n=1 Tax=Macrostomum lignano TaxID=282301 RepID=A0A1I8JRP1_9PLAT